MSHIPIMGLVLTITLMALSLATAGEDGVAEKSQTFKIYDWPDMMSACRMAVYVKDQAIFHSLRVPIEHPIELYTQAGSTMPAVLTQKYAHACLATLSYGLRSYVSTTVGADPTHFQAFVAARGDLGSAGHYIHCYVTQEEWEAGIFVKASRKFTAITLKKVYGNIQDSTGLVALVRLDQDPTSQPRGIQISPDQYDGEYHKICSISYGTLVNKLEVVLDTCGMERDVSTRGFEAFKAVRQAGQKLEPHILMLNSGSGLVHPDIVPFDKVPDHTQVIVESLKSKVSNYSILTETRFSTSLPENPIQLSTFTLPWLVEDSLAIKSGFIPTRKDSFNFVSCDKEARKMSLTAYLKPFDLGTWLCLGLALAVLILIIKSAWREASGVIFYVISIFVENPSGRIRASPILGGEHMIRLFLGLAFLMGIIISNAYKGVLTVSTTIPPPSVQPELWRDMKDFQLFTQADPSYQTNLITSKEWEALMEGSKYHSYVHHPDVWKQMMEKFNVTPGHPALLTHFAFNALMALGRMEKPDPDQEENMRFLAQRITFPLNFPNVSIEQVVSECRKTAFIDHDSELGYFKPVFKQGESKKFVKGKESLFPICKGWQIMREHASGGYLRIALRRLAVESGLENWLKYKKPLADRGDLSQIWTAEREDELSMNQERKLSLASNVIQSLFTIWISLLTMSLIVFSVEKGKALPWGLVVEKIKPFSLCQYSDNSVHEIDNPEFVGRMSARNVP